MVQLGVNIDHVATLRQQRRGRSPEPLHAALEAEAFGADGIVAHLREDRRHMQERDIQLLVQTVRFLSLEMAATEAMEVFALTARPPRVCLVPEKRAELTTEGGLDVIGQRTRLQKMIRRLSAQKIEVSLFVDPDLDQVKCAQALGADTIELHTGAYANASHNVRQNELNKLRKASELAVRLKLHLHAGHGLDYENVLPVARLPGMEELNIGFSIVARAIFVGFGRAVHEMKELIG